MGVEELKVQGFVTFLANKAFKHSTEEEIENYVGQLDIDNDGIISEDDVSVFFNRKSYISDTRR
jgi:Ca2+-binding EF-hand superfamily protein